MGTIICTVIGSWFFLNDSVRFPAAELRAQIGVFLIGSLYYGLWLSVTRQYRVIGLRVVRVIQKLFPLRHWALTGCSSSSSVTRNHWHLLNELIYSLLVVCLLGCDESRAFRSHDFFDRCCDCECIATPCQRVWWNQRSNDAQLTVDLHFDEHLHRCFYSNGLIYLPLVCGSAFYVLFSRCSLSWSDSAFDWQNWFNASSRRTINKSTISPVHHDNHD